MADRLNQFNVEDSANQSLPKAWGFCNVSEIAKVFLGKTPKKSHYRSNGKNKVVKFRDLKPGYLDFTKSKDGFVVNDEEIVSSLRKLEKNDVLITSAAHSGENIGKKCAYVKEMPSKFRQIFFTGELLNLRADYGEVLAKWIYFYFLSNEGFKEIQNAVKGVHLTTGRAQSMRIKIAPWTQQYLIVAKLEQLLSKVDKCKERLEKIPTILKRFRQSILAAACSGELTKDWRNHNPGIKSDTKLLIQNRLERKKKYEEECLTAKTNGKRKPAPFKRNDQPVNIQDLDEIPETWYWDRLVNIANIRGGVTKGRKFGSRKTVLIPYLRVANVQDGYLDLREIKEIKALPEDLEKYRLENGDILYTEGGDRDKLGRGTVWKNNINDCIHQNHIFRARLYCSKFSPEYISLATKSDHAKSYFFENASQTVNLASINMTTLGNVPLAIPPEKEQIEIVRRVEDLFKVADKIEARYQKGKTHIERLAQSILTKAFRGELVPQDPSDPSASELLKQIKTKREKQQAQLKAKKNPKRKAKRKSKKKT